MTETVIFVAPTAPSLTVPIDINGERQELQFKHARLELSGDALLAFEAALANPKAVAARQLVRRVDANVGESVVAAHRAQQSMGGAVTGAFDSSMRVRADQMAREAGAGNVMHAAASGDLARHLQEMNNDMVPLETVDLPSTASVAEAARAAAEAAQKGVDMAEAAVMPPAETAAPGDGGTSLANFLDHMPKESFTPPES